VLGLVVRVVVDPLGFVEHVLGERPAIQTGRRDRRRQVEVPGAQRFGQAHGVTRPLHVRDVLAVGVGGEVVDRGEVEEVIDRRGELVGVDPEALQPRSPSIGTIRSSSTPHRARSSSTFLQEPARQST